MQLRKIPRCGMEVSAVGIGCNNFGNRSTVEESKAVIERALDIGITLFDTADGYPLGNRGASETIIGETLGARRKDIVLATKFGIRFNDDMRGGASRAYIMRSVEASLTRLKTDWIDLYQLHIPDGTTPMEETLRALDDLVSQGKVRYIGNSNFTAWQMVDADWTAKANGLSPFVSCQNEYSLLNREVDRELLPAMAEYGLGFLPFFPLASGLLTGKYRRGTNAPEGTRFNKTKMLGDRFMTDENWDTVEALQAFCDARGHSMLELAFSWQLANPTVWSVIAGASSPEQVDENAAASEWELTAEDLAEIDQITNPPTGPSHG
ncbi:MAG: aldo/keto reductase [Rhodospirillaceae bacterium]|nr:aldo/keto reductase [Rhodospirillaceae bacterium]MBT4672047.1 aldo/keto reductase [Rhodospirillaceae bacterium]